MTSAPNYRPALAAATAFCSRFGRHWRGASEAGRSVENRGVKFHPPFWRLFLGAVGCIVLGYFGFLGFMPAKGQSGELHLLFLALLCLFVLLGGVVLLVFLLVREFVRELLRWRHSRRPSRKRLPKDDER